MRDCRPCRQGRVDVNRVLYYVRGPARPPTGPGRYVHRKEEAMAGTGLRWGRARACCAVAVVLVGALLVGCNKGGKAKAGGTNKQPPGPPKSFTTVETPAWQKPFKDAVRAEPPAD